MADYDQQDPDAALMPRIATGDSAAYRTLVDRHADRLLAFAFRLLGDRAAAEDVVQDTYLSLWRKAGDWTPRARVSTWLYRVARNAALDRLRRARPSVDVDQTILIDDGPRPDHGLDEAATVSTVRAALDALPERQRAAIVLVHYEGLSGAEASSVLDITVEALESLLARGRRTLRRALEPRREELLGETG